MLEDCSLINLDRGVPSTRTAENRVIKTFAMIQPRRRSWSARTSRAAVAQEEVVAAEVEAATVDAAAGGACYCYCCSCCSRRLFILVSY